MTLLSIVIVLMGYFNEVSVNQIKTDIETFYKVPVSVIKDKLPRDAYYPTGRRYRADSILNYLYNRYPGKIVIALTSVDISTTSNNHKDWGVFGLGSLKNNVCVVSTYRIKNKNLNDRMFKVVMHELGHAYKLEHCQSKIPCMMQAAEHSAKKIDKEPKSFCPSCNKKLQQVSKNQY